MKPPSLPRELADHLEAFCLGELTVDAAKRLEELVLSDPVHCEHLVRFTMMHASALPFEAVRPDLLPQILPLREADTDKVAPVEAAKATKPQVTRTARRQTAWRRSLVRARLVAAVLFVMYFASISWNLLSKKRAADHEATVASGEGHESLDAARRVAVVWSSENAVWKSVEVAPEYPQSEMGGQRSEILPGKPLHLASGIVSVQLKRGVTLLIEGPARWTVDGENTATLHRGKLVAQVPPKAVGFKLEVPQGSIVDLGTEFGVDVSEHGAASVHVLVGKVAMQSGGTKPQPAENAVEPGPQVLRAGQSALIDSQRLQVAPNESLAEKFRLLSRAGEQLGKENTGYDVVFHYRFGADDPSAKAGQPAAQRLLGWGEQGPRHPLERVGMPRYTLGSPDDATKLSLDIPGGQEAAGYLGSGFADLSIDAVVFEAWVRPRSAKTLAMAAYLGHPSYNGYGFLIDKGKWALLYGGLKMIHTTDVSIGQWTHLAWVREVGRSVLFVNGETSGPEHRYAPQPPAGTLHLGHAPGNLPQTFDGQIAEVRLIRLKKYFDPRMFLLESHNHQESPAP